MSGLGGNLTYKDRPLLITNLAVTDFGFYSETDPDTSVDKHHLLIKSIGLDLVYDSSVKVSKSCTQEGALKSILLSVNGPCPCEDCGYEYGIDVVKKVKNPGVLNDDYPDGGKSRFYGGSIASLAACASGEIADADKLTIEDDILTQILNDRNLGTREESIVDGKRVYLVTITEAATDAITITDADGSETILLNGGATMATALHDFNTDNTKGLVAFPKSSTQMFITSTAVGKLFTIVDGGGASTVTIDERYMWITARTIDSQFEVKFDYGFLTLERFNVAIIQTDAAFAGDFGYAMDGTAYTEALAANSQTLAASLIANADAGYYGATVSGNYKPIYCYSGVYEYKIKSLGTAGCTLLAHYSGAGTYPNLTWQDVFREFSEMKHLNGLSHIVSTSMPVTGDKFCKITIEKDNTIANMHGASHSDGYRQAQTIYIKQGSGSTHLWDASNYMWESLTDSATFAVDSDINDLIVAWGTHGSLANPGIL